MRWQWTEVDGVTTLRLNHHAFPGPISAGLVFGLGRADEAMLVTGITHIIEHLVLQPLTGAPGGTARSKR
jgi:zinc protease